MHQSCTHFSAVALCVLVELHVARTTVGEACGEMLHLCLAASNAHMQLTACPWSPPAAVGPVVAVVAAAPCPALHRRHFLQYFPSWKLQAVDSLSSRFVVPCCFATFSVIYWKVYTEPLLLRWLVVVCGYLLLPWLVATGSECWSEFVSECVQ